MAADPTGQHLVLFARQPRYGVGKRRLAADVGDLEALRFARASLDRLRRTLGTDPRWTLWLAVSPDRPTGWAAPARVIAQGPGNLGDRLDRVVRTLPPGPVVILGADTPTVTRQDVADAFAALGAHDAVFGPARDGGYWLIGLRRRPRQHLPFARVRWSTEHALTDTMAAMGARATALLRVQEDIDDGPSLRRYLSGSRRG
ncbi:TIGR04282 family arsenosugar biosynthesis glycosyltransferase [uncultured Brevundimonas sp.]|uniref:TIGR04282 family arsenosugar biosynthesis glycosyltransferase n=1 Tax=uncultured Brevundimonas sp. TaxID=213418 RepID=UPI0030EF4719|tara:strand:+ start:160782 stop:161384 length:603 start_codon:yes stop_codon:yes gene_type:complete